jgi:hypothetical protein
MFYGMVILVIVLGGLVLLVMFSLLAMAKECDEFCDQQEKEQPRAQE